MKHLLLVILVYFSIGKAATEKFMEVIIPSYNNAPWYQKNLSSIFNQKYSNYHVTYIDDCSSDGTADLVMDFVKNVGQVQRFTLVRNTERRGALENLYHAIHECPDDTIIVTIDGDDWLYNDKVFQKLNNVYKKRDIWLTHGRLIETANEWAGWCIPVPKSVIKKNNFRSYRCPSHLRTFYAWLFKRIKREDLMYEGQFFPMAWDQAMMFPMLEMAGKRHVFMKDILYVYNTMTSISDNKVNPQLQKRLEAIIRSMPKYDRLPG